MSGRVYDFRSDTVTRPDEGMRAAIYAAEVGDDVYGEDRTVNHLEDYVAGLLGKQAGLFVSSGTQSNLIAILAQAGRGDEFITGSSYHSNYYEAGGAAVLGSVVPCTLPVGSRGELAAGDVAGAVKPDDPHHPVSRLLCLENTVNGYVQDSRHLATLCALAHERGLYAHLDGARLMNASVASNQTPSHIAAPFDSVSVCLSKGLGAPAGSVLVGSAEMIARARRLRKMLGGGMRQAGLLAAAGLYALEHNVQRLETDHENARFLAAELAGIKNVDTDPGAVDTNMVFMRLPEDRQAGLKPFLAGRNIIISPPKKAFRLVLHKDIDRAGVAGLAAGVSAYMSG